MLKKIIFVFSFLQPVLALVAQDSAVQTLTRQLETYRNDIFQEKLFMHTDKSVYTAGEILWFKLYNVDASFHMPVSVSKVAYVELLDGENKPALQAKIALRNSTGSGSFVLPAGLAQGVYILRAYTSWMKNFSPDYFFEKQVVVVNTKAPAEFSAVKKDSGWDARFFPEGGSLVESLASKVGFKITSHYGHGINGRGFIMDGLDTIVQFHSEIFGMGNFKFTPLPGHSYHAFISAGNGQLTAVTLPSIAPLGYVMSLEHTDNHKIAVHVQTNIPGSREIYLVAHTREIVKSAMAGYLSGGVAEFMIEDSLLSEGISHFTVFNNDKQPVCERLYFTFPSSTLSVNAHFDQAVYGLREKVSLSIQDIDKNRQPVIANMSLSVYHLDSLQAIDEATISDYLLLRSDIKGYIESPGYYFNSTDNGKKAAMDNLMLTQGWRRFNWTAILIHKTPVLEFVPEFNGHVVHGKVIDTRTGRPTKKIMAYLSVPSVWAQFATSLSDSAGNVHFEMKNMYGSREIIVQTHSGEDSSYRIDITNPFIEKYSVGKPFPSATSLNLPHTLVDRQVSVQVQNIYAGEKLRRYIPNSDTLPFFKKPNESYLLDLYTRFLTLEEVMREYVLAMNVRIRNNHFHLPVVDIRRNEFMEKDPLVLLDGVPIFDFDKFMKTDPLKIKKLDLVTSRYYLGPSTFDGILSFSTYKGDLYGFDLDPHATVIDYEGLQLQREFYMPVYDTKQQISGHMPDFRNVLYWSPDVKTRPDGKENIRLFTSDIPGKYAATLQGITADGKFGATTITFEVKD